MPFIRSTVIFGCSLMGAGAIAMAVPATSNAACLLGIQDLVCNDGILDSNLPVNNPRLRWLARGPCSCHVSAVRTTFTRRLITAIRIHTQRISSASPLLMTSWVAGPNSVREVLF